MGYAIKLNFFESFLIVQELIDDLGIKLGFFGLTLGHGFSPLSEACYLLHNVHLNKLSDTLVLSTIALSNGEQKRLILYSF